jgi:hypothetical protein
MTGIHELKIANYFVVKPVNIPDIHCVSRLGNCSLRRLKRLLLVLYLLHPWNRRAWRISKIKS